MSQSKHDIVITQFIRDFEAHNRLYMNIPSGIVDTVYKFYPAIMGIDTNRISEDLRVHNITTVVNTSYYWATAILDGVITNDMCDIFGIEFVPKLKGSSNYFMVGFVTDSIASSINDWETWLNDTPNRNNTVAIKCNHGGFRFYDKDNFSKKIEIDNSIRIKTGDRLQLSYHFKAKHCSLYYNDNVEIYSFALNAKQITPALSLFSIGTEVTVTNWYYK